MVFIQIKGRYSNIFENDPDNEFDDYKWVSYWYPLTVIISFKERVYFEALNKLKYSFVMNLIMLNEVLIFSGLGVIGRLTCRNVWYWWWFNYCASSNWNIYKFRL